MYEQKVTRKYPGCIIFLLDRSESMKRVWEGTLTLAEGAAQQLNGILMELCMEARQERGLVYHYFDIGIFGYGVRPVAGGEGVESALGGKLAGYTLAPLPELHDNPIAVREVPAVDLGAPPARAPVWVEPMHQYRTPMCEAMSVAGEHAFGWAQSHPDSFPPIIINITDGIVTDSPFGGATLGEWAERLTGIETKDGRALLFNIFLSPDARDRKIFPAEANDLPAPGPELFRISSVLPPPMVADARDSGITVPAEARGFAFNADLATLGKFLRIGTNVV